MELVSDLRGGGAGADQGVIAGTTGWTGSVVARPRWNTGALRSAAGFVIAFETLFGLPDERLTIRHDAGSGAEPYAAGTLLAVR